MGRDDGGILLLLAACFRARQLTAGAQQAPAEQELHDCGVDARPAGCRRLGLEPAAAPATAAIWYDVAPR